MVLCGDAGLPSCLYKPDRYYWYSLIDAEPSERVFQVILNEFSKSASTANHASYAIHFTTRRLTGSCHPVLSCCQTIHSRHMEQQQSYLEQVYLADALLLHQVADSGHATNTILAVVKEVVRHLATLQLLLLLHVTGGVARHGREVPEHYLSLLCS